jgi:hypothetical protein
MRSEYQQRAFREVQGARISRWIRESEAGWLFYGPDGTAWHITASEAERLEAEGRALIERSLDGGFSVLRGWRGLLAISLAAAFAAMLLLPFGRTNPFLVANLWFIVTIPVIVIVAIANDVAYELALRRWRGAAALRLRRQKRGGVPQQIADKHRRYNIFQIIVILGALAYGIRIVLMMSGVIETGMHPIDLAILAVTVLAAWPADRVNRTHRRRKWFD